MRAQHVPGPAGGARHAAGGRAARRDPGPRGLGGTGLVADDLYLTAHHEVTGRPFLRARALRIGLVDCLLAELMLTGSITRRPSGTLVPGRDRGAQRRTDGCCAVRQDCNRYAGSVRYVA